MGVMKDFLVTIHNGGDEAVAAVQRMGDDWRAMLEQAASEIEALRLTDAEREALRGVLDDPDLVLGDRRKPLEGLLARCAIGHQDGPES